MDIEVVVVVVVVAASEEIVETGAAGAILRRIKIKRLGEHPSIRGPSTPTSQPVTGSGVVCTSVGGVPPFSVPNLPPAHGKMFLHQSNETVTNSVNMI